MITFPFNENRFSFFAADHLLVGQLCTNPKSDRSLLSCLKVQIWIGTNNRDVPRVKKTKFPATVKVFGVLSSEGRIIPPHIFEVGLKVNTKVYLDVLKSVVICWCNQVAGGRPLDVAAGLGTGSQVQRDPGLAFEGVLRLCTLRSLAPSSPDLNPLDYFVWSYVENITNMTSHNTKASLIAGIRRVFAKLPPALVEKVYSLFRIRIEALIEAEGGYIE